VPPPPHEDPALKVQGYFIEENDHTHVIKVVVLVVKITIQKKEVM
jgi:hypothetical protein